MKIWIIDHYATPPKYHPLARQTIFARKLGERGHNVVIFCASTVHNSNVTLDNGASLFREEVVDGVKYVFVTCRKYKGNGINRVLNMIEFASKLSSVVKHYDKPDAVISCSMTLQACKKGITLARKYGARAIAQITDLWPETLVTYSGISPQNPIIRYLRAIEKNIYLRADSIVFSAAGEYNYIIEQGWQKEIPKEKVYYINNGIDLKLFDYNKTAFITEDKDLDDDSLFKVIYTGSIRRVNNLGGVLDVAKKVTDPRVRFLIWGDGDELPNLKQRLVDEKIANVKFKGRVDKNYIPYITSKADLNYAHNTASPLFKYGLSFNKIFDYLAAGKPILCDFPANYNPVIMGSAGVSVDSAAPEDIARQIEEFVRMDLHKYEEYCVAARKTAAEYDFEVLTDKLLEAINGKKK